LHIRVCMAQEKKVLTNRKLKYIAQKLVSEVGEDEGRKTEGY